MKKINKVYIVFVYFLNLCYQCECKGISAENEDNIFKCFNNEEHHDQHIFTSTVNQTIGIQVSHRVTHQLISRIFAIFLHEVLGYQNVTLIPIYFDNTEEDYKLFITLGTINQYDPWSVAMLDLEVWLPPDYHAIPHQISEAGLVTYPGRYGWFYPTEQLKGNELYEFPEVDYTLFTNTTNEEYKSFIIEDEILQFLEKNYNIKAKLIPPICENNTCVTLFAEFYNDTGFVKYPIKEYNFYTKVFWFGEDYKSVVSFLWKRYEKSLNNSKSLKRFILLHWTPSDIIDADKEYKSILMPKCEDMKSAKDTLCKYELTPLLKYYSQKLKNIFHAFHALQYFEISRNDLQKLLIETNEKRLNSNNSIETIYNNLSCKWLKDHRNIYKTWIARRTINITIGGIFAPKNIEGPNKDVLKAIRMAENAINSNKTILKNFNLTVWENQGECNPEKVMRSFLYYLDFPEPFIGLLGPPCSEAVEAISGISKYSRMPVISYSADGASFADRQTYPYFFQTIGSNRQLEVVYLNIFQQLKWKRVAALTEHGQKSTEYISHMEILLKNNDIELVVNKKFTRDISSAEMRRHLLDLKNKRTTIIIADIHNDIAKMMFCEAFLLQMTAEEGYVWFLPISLTKNWSNETYIYENENITCTPSNIQEIINGHFSLTYSQFGLNSSIMQENRNISQWIKEYKENNPTPSIYAGYAYDAVWIYALAIDKLLSGSSTIESLHSVKTVNEFVNIIQKTNFNGVSGKIRFSNEGARINDVIILQYINKNFNEIGRYIPVVEDETNIIIGGNLILNDNSIQWLTKEGRPDDGTKLCGIASIAELLQTDCENATFVLTAIICIFAVILISLSSFIFWKRRYDKKLKQSAKVMRNFGIDLLEPLSNQSNTLDKWEIPKNRIVINRRLGEGAFGTVYGGEAQLNDIGWTAVAVKTLKIGASTEDRLDFLSEAEAMKRFDHKNIVSLLGVCLQTEPIYTIMEFMLYGDLKTFLLARRHLVTEKIADDSDISPKRLTMMALDVSRGLSYLADLKYVHRDIACRNCLVNAQRVVKLGDFGMSRPMFENDYYRFNRKGMLPVRWMAPESLCLGVFTPSSDVWSFGILLYEIITFGSFPYQGYTNNEVLEYIRNGNTLKIPAGTKPHLEALMKACWNQEYRKRPAASEIAEYITNYPRLLTPCLDVPITSVEMPETDSDQLELLPNLRKRICSQNKIDILTKATNINNFDNEKNIDTVYEHDLKSNIINLNSFNVPIDTTSNDENCIVTYSPMAPLLKRNSELTKSSTSLKQYVPMNGVKNKINTNTNLMIAKSNENFLHNSIL